MDHGTPVPVVRQIPQNVQQLALGCTANRKHRRPQSLDALHFLVVLVKDESPIVVEYFSPSHIHMAAVTRSEKALDGHQLAAQRRPETSLRGQKIAPVWIVDVPRQIVQWPARDPVQPP